jgi:hypothetical protein
MGSQPQRRSHGKQGQLVLELVPKTATLAQKTGFKNCKKLVLKSAKNWS